MKEASWNDCSETGSAVKISPDKGRIQSLQETAEARIGVAGTVNEKNCNFIFEDYYTSLLELLQALMIVKGYRVMNHLCIGYYLRDVLQRADLFAMFDDVRYKSC